MNASLYIMVLMAGWLGLCGSPAFAAPENPETFNFDGILLDTGTSNPMTGPVNLRFEILDGSASCVLYKEDHLSIALDAGGGFSLPVGTGTSKVQSFGTGWKAIFANKGSTGGFTGCGAGVNLAPGSIRQLRVTVNGATVLIPNFAINAVPYATIADSIQGYGPSDFKLATANEVRLHDSAGNAGNYISLKAPTGVTGAFSFEFPAATGSANQVLTTNGAGILSWANPSGLALSGGTMTGNLNMGSQLVTNIAAPTAATDAANRGWVDGHVGSKVANLTGVGVGVGNGATLIWDAGANQWVTGTPSATDATKLPLAGGTLSGALNMGAQNITNTAHIQMGASSTLKMGSYTTGQEATLVSGTLTPGGASYEGTVWYNTTADQLMYWNGASSQPVNSDAVTTVAGRTGIVVLDVADITSGATKYFSYRPNNVACSNGQVLVWNNGSTRWDCGTPPSSQWTSSGSDVYFSGGNVGIGVATPSAPLEVNGIIKTTASGYGLYHDSGTVKIATYVGGGYGVIGTESNHKLALEVNQQDKMTIMPDGSIAMGAPTPVAGTILDIRGTGVNFSSVVVPRDTAANRPSGIDGMIRYNTSLAKFESFENGAWINMIAAGGLNPRDDASYDLNQANLESVFSITNLPKLNALLGNSFAVDYSFNNRKVINVGTPTAATDAATKAYVDALASNALLLAGGTMSGTINMGGSSNITNISQVGIGTTGPASKFHVMGTPPANSAVGLVSIGSVNFTGAGGEFSGHASGTSIAVNQSTGYAGSLIDLQINGSSRFKVSASGQIFGDGSTLSNMPNPISGLTAGRVLLSSGATSVVDSGNLTFNTGTGAATLNGSAAGLTTVGSMNFDAGNNGVDMYVASSGKVGIGTTTAYGWLDVTGAAGNPAVSGGSDAALIHRVSNGTNALDMGVSNAWAAGWIQTRMSAINGTGARLNINPTGGAVQIGSYSAPNDNYQLLVSQNGTTDAIVAKGNAGNLLTLQDNAGTAFSVFKADGKVGFGTNAPGSKVHIIDNTSDSLKLQATNASADPLMTFQSTAHSYQLGVGGPSGALPNKFYIYDAFNSLTRMVVDSGGNVGIGTDAPTSLLQVGGTPTAGLVSQTFGASKGQVHNASTSSALALYNTWGGANVGAAMDLGGLNNSTVLKSGTRLSGFLTTTTSGAEQGALAISTMTGGTQTEKVRVDSAGNVGIGFTSPGEKLDVNGNIKASGDVQIGNSGQACAGGKAGSVRYASGPQKLEMCDGISWKTIPMGPTSIYAGRTVNSSLGTAAFSTSSTYYGSLMGPVEMIFNTDTSGVTRSIVPRGGVMANFYVKMSQDPASTWVYTIVKNGTDTPVTCSVVSTQTSCNNTGSQIAVNPGDEIGLKIVTGGNGAASRVTWAVELISP